MKHITLFLALILAPQVAAAQRSSSDSDTVEGLPVPSWAEGIIDSFSRPLHPVVGGVASGGGVGVGIGYDSPDDARWYTDAEAMVTVRRYWSLDGEVGRQSASRAARLGVFAGVRHMNRIDYFGIGPHARFEDRSAFRLRESTFGTRGWVRPVPAVRLGGSAAIYLPDLGTDAHPTVPFITVVFPESTVPGFSAEPTFGRYRGFVELIHPAVSDEDDAAFTGYRGAYQVALEAVRDHDSGRLDFHRTEFETRHGMPGIRPGHRLTLHGFLASTNSGADVPFYMLYTLGGSGGLKAFRPDLLGGDRTGATLRGFRNYRFRDRDLVLMQAEYRVPVWQQVHATVFVDSGQVAPTRSGLLRDLRTTTGFSLSYVRNGRALGRMDVGFGGGEGVQLFWSFGAFDN
jgi:hypothetical protein